MVEDGDGRFTIPRHAAYLLRRCFRYVLGGPSIFSGVDHHSEMRKFHMSATSIRLMFFERKKHIADVWGSPVSQIGNIFLGTQNKIII